MARIPMEDIIQSSLDGIVQAHKDYENWSNGEWVWNAPEYMLTTYIAQKLAKIQGLKYITLENNVESVIADAGARGRGRLDSKIRSNGRCDILLWWGSDEPRAVIEVKNQISSLADKGSREDLYRISGMLERNNAESSLQFGLFCYYTSYKEGKKPQRKPEERIAERIKQIHDEAKELLDEKFSVAPYHSRTKVDGDSAWVAAALLIRLKQSNALEKQEL